jgi:uncharacterized repeat protein (TIGR03806 family)
MRRRWVLWWVAAACACAPGSEGQQVERDACAAFPRPTFDEVVALERVFPRVAPEGAIDLVRGGDRWFIATKPGIVYAFDDRDDASPEVYLDISDRVEDEAGEAGLLGIALHPDFEQNGFVYLSFTTQGGSPFLSRVSRFTRDDESSEREVITVEQPYSNHNGGDIAFGPDGYLYFGLGDGGSGSDPHGHGQNTDTLLGSILRLDVSVDEGYAIPPDNPFVDGGGRSEIFAYGLRNPWRFTFDRETGDLWAGDVGQNLWEEVDLVRNGGNYGWNVKEGAGCFGADACAVPELVDPIAEYRNVGVASVVGGFVYRGAALPDLRGVYLYNDFYLGTLWGVRPGEEPRVLNRGGAERISAWAEDADGELLAVSFNGGIFEVVAAPEREAVDVPAVLSQTGCVDPADPEVLPQNAIAYEVRVPFWSDGADKSRFAIVPTAIEADAEGDLHLPEGSVLVKSFTRDGALVETRLLVHDAEGWAGYSYAWREDGSDADLLLDGRVTDDWIFPDGQSCDFCHTDVAGGSLGLDAAQLDRDGSLAAFVDAGLVRDVPEVEPLADPFGADPLDVRARAYLHVNCSHCHRPDGPSGRADLDLRRSTALADTGLCNASPRAGDADVPDGRLLAPADPDRSILLARMRSLGSTRMPPVGSLRIDDAGSELIAEWIASLSTCP